MSKYKLTSRGGQTYYVRKEKNKRLENAVYILLGILAIILYLIVSYSDYQDFILGV